MKPELVTGGAACDLPLGGELREALRALKKTVLMLDSDRAPSSIESSLMVVASHLGKALRAVDAVQAAHEWDVAMTPARTARRE